MNGAPFRRHIYGIFDPDGWCHYVGQTRNITSRARAHFRAFGADFTFDVLDSTFNADHAAALEGKWITLLRALKNPLRNKSKGFRSALNYDLQDSTRFQFERIDTKERFSCYGHIAAVLECSPGTVSNAARFHLSPEQTFEVFRWRDEVFIKFLKRY